MRAPSKNTCVFSIIAFSLLIPLSVWGQVLIHIPTDQPTIQAGIDAAQNGDTVLVSPGTYNEQIDFKGKNITVTSSDGAAQTTIDGQQQGSVVYFHNNETSAAVLSGFTVQHGKSSDGGGIHVASGSPTIENNIIAYNGCGEGGGIGVEFASPTIRGNSIHHNNRDADCYPSGVGGGGISIRGAGQAKVLYNVIYENKGGYEGGGIGMWAAGQALVEGNLIRNNYSTSSAGGGMSIQNEGSSIVRNNVIVNNFGGGVDWGRIPGDFSNNTIAGNSSLPNTVELSGGSWWSGTFRNNVVVALSGGTALQCQDNSTYGITVENFTYNNVFSVGGAAYSCTAQTGANHNISVDPLFANAPAGNYHLSNGSPMIDVADGTVAGLPSTDADGNPRIVAGAGGPALLDIGGYEYQGTTTMSVSSTSLTFASQKTNTSSPAQTITITNTGAVALHLAPVRIGADFQHSNDCEAPNGVGAGKSCTVAVTFKPLTSGSKSEQLVLTPANGDSSTNVDLTGTATAPLVNLSTTSLNFADQALFTISPAQSVTITNIGDADLVIASIATSGDFAQFNTCGNGTLAPNASCVVSITFTPTATRSRTGLVTIQDDAVGSPHSISLSGNATGPEITFSDATVFFNPQSVNTISNPKTVTITNTGGADLIISNLQATGDFTQTNNCGTLGVNASCQISVQFLPVTTGPRTGALKFTDNAAASPQQVALSGQGTAPILQVRANPFGIAIYDATTSSGSVLLKNVGSEPLVISFLETTGDFSLDNNNCVGAFPPNTGCIASLTFTPTAAGTRSGTLKITHNGLTSPATVSLSATALSAYPVPTLSSVSPTAIAIGSGNTTVTITGTNFFNAGTTVYLDGQAVSTTYLSDTQRTVTLDANVLGDYGEHTIAVANPLPGGGISSSTSLVVYRPLPISARDLTYDPYRRVFYAPITAGSSANANAIVSIDPVSGTVTKLVDLGAEGRKIAISDDGQFLYVGVDSLGVIKRVNLYTHSIDLTVPLGSNFSGLNVALDILPLPGSPRSIAVAIGAYTSPQIVKVFDDDVARPNVPSYNNSPYYLAMASDPSLIYVGSGSGSILSVLKLDASGVTYVTSNFSSSLGSFLETDGKNLYSYSIVIDPSTLNQKGRFTFSDPQPNYITAIYPEAGTNRVYLGSRVYANYAYSSGIWAGNSDSYSTTGPLLLPLPVNYSWDIYNVTRWGTDGFAYRLYSGATNVGGTFDTDQIVFARSALAKLSPGPNPAPAITSLTPGAISMGSANFVLTVVGTDFIPGSVVRLNGSDRTTEFVDATHLKVFLPSTDFVTETTAKLTVMNPPSGGGTSNEVSFSVLSAVTVSPSALIFPERLVGSTSSAQSVTLANSSTGPIGIGSIVSTGDFSQANNCGSSLAAGDSCTVNVTFKPTSTGKQTGTLAISDTAPGSPRIVNLAGSAVSVPVAQLSTTALAFANQIINTSSAVQTVQLSNIGTEPLTIASVAVTGDFGQSNDCGASLAVGKSCTITVTFSPKAGGAASGELAITHNAATTPSNVALTGKGIDFSLSGMNGGTLSQTVTAGQPATYNLTLIGSDGFSGTASLTCSGVPNLATCAISPNSVTFNGTTPAPFIVTITTTGATGGLQSEVIPAGPGSASLLLTVLACAIFAITMRRRFRLAGAFVTLTLAVTMIACGGGGGSSQPRTPVPGTPAGTYTVVITATAGTQSRTMDLTLTVR